MTIMDVKQIMDETQLIMRDLIDLMKHQLQLKHQNQHENQVEEEEQQERGNGVNKDDIVPSYEEENYSSLDSIEPAKVNVEKDQNAFDTTILSEIDRTVKNHTENLVHVLEGVSARLKQLETKTHRLESYVDDLKVWQLDINKDAAVLGIGLIATGLVASLIAAGIALARKN